MSPLFHGDDDSKVGQDHAYSQWLEGLVTTRRGRLALAAGTVGQILDQVYARH